jgi:hypothetical protein
MEALLMPASTGDSSATGSARNTSAFFGIEPAPLEQPLHPRGDPREHDADLLVHRRRERMEIERASRAIREENAVELRIPAIVIAQSGGS